MKIKSKSKNSKAFKEEKSCHNYGKTGHWKKEFWFLEKDKENENIKPHKPRGKKDNDKELPMLCWMVS